MPYNLNIPGQFTERELWAIEAMAKLVPPGGVVVEVGSYLGLSSYAWAKSVDPSVTVYCIDAWEEDGEYAQKWQEKYGIDYSLEKFHEFTQTCSNIVVLKGFKSQIFADWDKSIDVYFQNTGRQHIVIIQENISLWSQFVKVDGLICGYGYGGDFPDVTDEVRKLANLYGVEPVIVEKIWCLTTGINVNKLNTITKINDIHGYEYELNIFEPPALLEPGDLLKVSGKLKNISGRDWNIFVDDQEIIKIGIQVYENNKPERQEFRSSLGVDKFLDGATIEFECLIDTKPLQQGKIRLVFDVVAEGRYWFEEKGAKPEIVTVQVLPRTARNFIKIGNQLKREGKLAEAIGEYRQAIELNPNFSWVYYNLGNALAKKGYINEAIEKYRKAIDLNSNSCVLFYHELGIALHTQGKIDEAINCFKKAKQLLKSKDNLTRQKYKYLMDSFLAKARLSLTGQSTYLSKKFTDLIDPDSINYILELGSRDGIDAVYLSKYYLCQVDAFECNPESIEICLNNLRAYKNINLVTKAVWDRNETISFYVTTNGNIGASSCFEETGDYPFEKYNPYQISVEAIRLDSYLTRNPDLICMDLQGAELNALKGLGDFLKGVKYIITELEVKPLYKDQCLFDDVVEFLKEWGFELQKYIPVYHKWFGDALFVNKSLVKIPP